MTETTKQSDKRTRILDAAEELFARRGFAATSVRQIVDAANVTNPMLYYYFGSKEELFLQLFHERFEYFRTELGTRLEGARSLEEILYQWCGACFEDIEEEETTIRFIFGAIFGPRENLPTQFIGDEIEKHHEMLAEAIAREIPSLPMDRIRLAIILLQGMLTHLIFHAMDAKIGPQVPTSALVECMVATILPVFSEEFHVPEVLKCS